MATLDPLPSPGRRELSRSKTLVMRSSRVQSAYFEASVMIRRCPPERRNLYRNQAVIPHQMETQKRTRINHPK